MTTIGRIATPLHPLFAAELTGIDLAAGIDAKTQDTIARTMDQYAVTVLPDQHLDDEKQSAFASLYGPLEVAPQTHSKEGGPAAPSASRTATSSTSPTSTNTARS